MNLVIFDIDGTLTDTNAIDGACFKRALQMEFGIEEISLKWESYRHTTDSGIAAELLTAHLGREPMPMELERIRTRFVHLLKEAHAGNPNHFKEIPGAAEILNLLANHADWKVAIATGAWLDSARLKLWSAGITGNFPLASCDECVAREDIIQKAIFRAKCHYESLSFSQIVYVGDGIWDVNAARALGIGFIGISSRGQGERLQTAGARFIFDSFRPPLPFLNTLKEWKYANSN